MERVFMKIKQDFLLREIADTNIVIPVGERVADFKGMMTLNKTGRFIWEKMLDGIAFEDLVKAIVDKYEVDEATARTDLNAFIDSARESGVLEE
jgi:hypothetical protein